MADIGANDFYNTLVELGERVTFNPGTRNAIHQYASITPNRLNKAIATTDGAYWFTGNMTFDSIEQQEELAGSYFCRSVQPRAKLILISVFPENSAPRVADVHCVECNETVDIVSHYEDTGETDEYSNPIMRPVYTAKNVDVYITMYTQAAKDSVVGSVDTTTMYMTIPAKYTISSENRIMKDAFVYDPETHQNVIKKLPYQVESVDTSMMDISRSGKPIGVLKCLLKEAQE